MQQFGIKIHTLYVFTMPMFQEFMKPPKKNDPTKKRMTLKQIGRILGMKKKIKGKGMMEQKNKNNGFEFRWKNFRNKQK